LSFSALQALSGGHRKATPAMDMSADHAWPVRLTARMICARCILYEKGLNLKDRRIEVIFYWKL